MFSCLLSFMTMISLTISSFLGWLRKSICLIATCALGPFVRIMSCAIRLGAPSRMRATYTDPEAP